MPGLSGPAARSRKHLPARRAHPARRAGCFAGRAARLTSVAMPTRGADRPFRPTREQLQSAAGRTLPDLIAPGLRVLFCGINPGLYSAAIGHHFGRPGNRFWPTLHAAGFTPRQLSPAEDDLLLARGYGITNLVD